MEADQRADYALNSLLAGRDGTISGTARYLKEVNPDMRIIGVDAYGSVLKKYHETGGV